MERDGRIDDYIRPNQGLEYKLSVGEHLESVKALESLVDVMLLDNAEKVAQQDDPTGYERTKFSLSAIAKLDDGSVAGLTASRTYMSSGDRADILTIFDAEQSMHVYSNDHNGMVRRLDLVGEDALEVFKTKGKSDLLNFDNIIRDQQLGLNNQPVEASEIADLRLAVEEILRNS